MWVRFFVVYFIVDFYVFFKYFFGVVLCIVSVRLEDGYEYICYGNVSEEAVEYFCI